MVRAGSAAAGRPSSRKTNPVLPHQRFFGLLRRDMIPSFRGDAKHRTRNPSNGITCHEMDTGLALRAPRNDGREIALRSGTSGHQITFPTIASADIIGFK